MNELELRIKWENEDSFEMAARDEGGNWITVIRVEENGEIAALWTHIQKICITFLAERLRAIGDEMKAKGG